MGLKPTFFLAEFESGNFIDTLPLEGVRLRSRTEPGQFSATLDLRKTGLPMATARGLVERMKHGRTTLVPARDDGDGYVSMGEWWIAKVTGSYRSPIVQLSGPEFVGYMGHILNAGEWQGPRDPVITMRQMLSAGFRNSQYVRVDLADQTSANDTKVDVDVRDATSDYLSLIQDLQGNPDGPFEWVMRTHLAVFEENPIGVLRTLDVGQPVLSVPRDDVTLEVTAPGLAPASLLDMSWGWDEAASASDVTGWGAGHGDDQIGPVKVSRARVEGEPEKSRLVTNRDAMTVGQLGRTSHAALRRFTPEEKVSTAVMPVGVHTPGVGERYQWRSDATWTRAEESGTVRCVGWSWQSSDPENYELEVVR